jgi:hypothetical protein
MAESVDTEDPLTTEANSADSSGVEDGVPDELADWVERGVPIHLLSCKAIVLSTLSF